MVYHLAQHEVLFEFSEKFNAKMVQQIRALDGKSNIDSGAIGKWVLSLKRLRFESKSKALLVLCFFLRPHEVYAPVSMCSLVSTPLQGN